MNGSGVDLVKIIENLVIANRDIEHQNVNFYLDTSDTLRAILGAQSFNVNLDDDDYKTDSKNKFESPKTLIACLISSGFIGQFSLLPPHQAEFLIKFEKKQISRRIHNRPEDSSFLKAVGIIDPSSLHITEISGSDEIHSYVRKYAGAKAETFFKAIQCIRLPWWEQLKRMRGQGILVSYDKRNIHNLVQLERSAVLRDLIMFREKNRKNSTTNHPWSINNFNDAFALLMLADLVKWHNKDRRRPIPRMYDPDGVFSNMAEQAGIAEHFLIRSEQGDSSAFVPSEYFVYRASLRAKSSEERSEIINNIPSPDEIVRIRNSIQGGEPKEFDTLRNRLEEWLQLTFLKNVWLPTVAEDDVRRIVSRWAKESGKDYRAQIRGRRFLDMVKKTVREAKNDVLDSARGYREFGDCWTTLNDDVEAWKKRLSERDNPDEGSIDMMLLRVCPPVRTMEKLRKHLHAIATDLSDEESELTGTEAFSRLFTALYNFTKRGSTGYSADKVEYVAGALWSINPESALLKGLRDYADSRNSFYVAAVCTGAALRRGDDYDWARAMIAMLDSRNGIKRKSKIPPMPTNSSIAYLWFQLWRTKWSHGAWWRLRSRKPTSASWLTAEDYINKAIDSVDRAWIEAQCSGIDDIAGLPPNLRERIIYVTNQRLYYLVEQGRLDRLDDMRETYEVMTSFRGSSRYWKTTYEDTISRYFAFRAECSDKDCDWSNFFELAERTFKEAKHLKNSTAIKQFSGYLPDARSAGFMGNARNTGRGLFATFNNSVA